MMESSYENNIESFKKFLSDFCANVIVETEETEDLPFHLVSKQLTFEELEAESLEWSIRYLSKYKCPHILSAAISRFVYESVRHIDTTELQLSQEDEKAEIENEGSDIIAQDKDIVLDADKVCSRVINRVHEVCKKWKDDLPDLSTPKNMLYTCTHEIKNTRRKMEDRHVTIPHLNTLYELTDDDHKSFFAVFDGHAGVEAANYAAAHIPYHFVHSEAFPRDPASALKAAFKSTDEKFIAKAARERLKSGSTGVLAFIEKNKLYIAWLGDSQALLVRSGQSVKVMNPHKPEREDEQARIEALGGCILFMGTWRVNGNLSVSRAIGDVAQKKFISSDADTTVIDLDGTEDYLILACDGLWDVIDPSSVVKLVYEHVQSANGDLSGVAKYLVLTAKDLGSSDNITVTVVFFKNDISPPEIPQTFNFGISETQGKPDLNKHASYDSGDRESNMNKTDRDNGSSNYHSGDHSGNVSHGNKTHMGNNLEDGDQSIFISSYEIDKQRNESGVNKKGDEIISTHILPKNPIHVLKRNEPVFIIESPLEKQRQHFFPSPLKLESHQSTISGFRRHYDNISVADLRDFSVETEKLEQSNSDVKPDSLRIEDSKENIVVSDSSLYSAYVPNTNKHSEPYYNKSIFEQKRKHHRKHRSKERGQNETVGDTKRSRRHRELSPIVWNFTGTTKPSVNNYKLTYTKTSSNSMPRYSVHSHGNLSETPITVRKSLPDLSLTDRNKPLKSSYDLRYTEKNELAALHQSIDLSNTLSKLDSSQPLLPKLKLHGTLAQSHSVSQFPTTWKPRKSVKMVSGNITDVPPSPLYNHKLYPDHKN